MLNVEQIKEHYIWTLEEDKVTILLAKNITFVRLQSDKFTVKH